MITRRRFCFSMGAAIAGTSVLGGAGTAICGDSQPSAQREEPLFLVNKLHLEQWSDRIGSLSPARQLAVMKRQMQEIAAQCGAILLCSGSRVSQAFRLKVEREAQQAGIPVYVPNESSLELPNRFESAVPLRIDAETEQRSGFLFAEGNQKWIVLYDASRCRWETFLPQSDSTQLNSTQLNSTQSGLKDAGIVRTFSSERQARVNLARTLDRLFS